MIRDDCSHLKRSTRRFAVRTSAADWLSRHGYPRIAVAGTLILSYVVGIVSSIGLSTWGLSAMWLRYPLALGVSYVTFLFLLRVLVFRAAGRLASQCDRLRRDSHRRQFFNDAQAPPDILDFIESFSDRVRDCGQHVSDPRAVPAYVACLLATTVVLVCVYFTWIAPYLLAELLVDGALLAALYKPSWGSQTSWLTVALEETGMPALFMAASVTLTAVCFQLYVPGATSIDDVWRHVARPAEQRHAPNLRVDGLRTIPSRIDGLMCASDWGRDRRELAAFNIN